MSKPIFSIILLILPFSVQATPESRLGVVSGRLAEFQERLDVFSASRSKTLATSKVHLNRLFQKAQSYYAQREFLATIGTLKAFLSQVQTPDFNQHLEAKYLLGESYQQVGQNQKSIRAFTEYLETYLSFDKPAKDRLISVIQNLLLLVENNPAADIKKVRQLISSLASISLPADSKSRLLFYLALTSDKTTRTDYADSLFNQARELEKYDPSKAEILYYSGLIAYKNGKFAQAKAAFELLLTFELETTDLYANLAKLNLARLLAKTKNHQQALTLLSQIAKTSVVYEQALFAMTAASDHAAQHEQAVAYSQEYLKKYPQSDKAGEVKHFHSLLLLKAGLIDRSIQSIETNLAALKAFQEWLKRSFGRGEDLGATDVDNILSRGRFLGDAPLTVAQFQKLFRTLQQQRQDLGDIRSEVRSLTFHLGSLDAKTFDTAQHLKAEQILKMANENFALGGELLDIERVIFAGELSSTEELRLQRSAQRRQQLSRVTANRKHQVDNWRPWLAAQKLQVRLASSIEELRHRQATLNSLAYNDQRGDSEDISKRLLAEARTIENTAARAFELIRKIQISQFSSQSESYFAQSAIIKMSQLIYEESAKFADLRDRYLGANEAYMISKLQQAWHHWEYNTKLLYQQARSSLQTLKAEAELLARTIQTHTTTHDALIERNTQVTTKLRHDLTRSSYQIQSHYLTQLELRRADLMKWRADARLIAYTQQRKNNSTTLSKLERQIIEAEEDMKDLEIGVE